MKSDSSGTSGTRSNKFPEIKEILPARSVPEIKVGFLEGIDCHLKCTYMYLTCWQTILSPVLFSEFVPYISVPRLYPAREAENLPADSLARVKYAKNVLKLFPKKVLKSTLTYKVCFRS